MMMHHDMEGAQATSTIPAGIVRRLIFLEVGSPDSGIIRADMFGINTRRVPRFFADVDIHNLVVLNVQSLGPGTGWGHVPTPMF
jgi:hypothetical protein